jgi:hypothetical protein
MHSEDMASLRYETVRRQWVIHTNRVRSDDRKSREQGRLGAAVAEFYDHVVKLVRIGVPSVRDVPEAQDYRPRRSPFLDPVEDK